MGRSSIGVSGFALTVSRAIRAQVGVRRLNQSEFARLIGRSPTYVRERINDEKEWALGDIERMCNLWDLQPSQLIEGAPRMTDIPPTDTTPALADTAGADAGDAAREARRRELDETAARESRLEEETLRQLEADPLSLAAYHDPHKHDPQPDNAA